MSDQPSFWSDMMIETLSQYNRTLYCSNHSHVHIIFMFGSSNVLICDHEESRSSFTCVKVAGSVRKIFSRWQTVGHNFQAKQSVENHVSSLFGQWLVAQHYAEL